MRKIVLAFVVLTLSGSGLAFADTNVGGGTGPCPEGKKLQRIGSIRTVATASFGAAATPSGTTVSTRGHSVVRIIGACGGTACVVGVYNTDTAGEAVNADAVVDPGAPANTVFDLTFEGGLYFSNGISVGETAGNASNIAFYECREP